MRRPGETGRSTARAASAVLAAAAVVGCQSGNGEPTRPGGLVVNEVVASPGEGGTDWIELLATGDGPVDPSAFALRDGAAARLPEALPAGLLSPGELLVVLASREPLGDAGPQVGFQLGDSDEVVLERGGTEVDRLSWSDGEARRGVSFGRLPDGTGPGQSLEPTPGAPNRPLADESGEEPEGDLFAGGRVVELRLDMAEEDWQALVDDPLAEEYFPADLSFDGVRVSRVAVRTKGNSSLRATTEMGSVRFPLKVDIDHYVDGQRLFGQRKLGLSPAFKDPSFIREHLTSLLAQDLGLPAPRTSFVDLWIGERHIGLYTLVEEVDRTFLADRFGDDSGDLYKPEGRSGSLVWRGEAIDAYPDIGPETNEETTDHAALLRLLDALRAGDPAAYQGVIDVDEVLRYLALVTMLASLDSYVGSGHNYYLYEIDGVFRVIPWDFNEAFGSFTCGCDRQGLVDLLVDEPTCGAVADRPLVDRLLAVPEHRERYHDHLRALLDGPFSVETMGARIAEAAALVRPYVEADPTRHFSVEDFETALVRDLSFPGGRGLAMGLGSFVSERGAAVAAQLSGASPASASGEGSCPEVTGPPDGEPPPDGSPPSGPCGDGVCDDFEQANPGLCPPDCA